MTKRIIKYSLSIMFLSMFLVLTPVKVDFTASNRAQAAGWWDQVNQGGLQQVGQAYGQTDVTSENNDIRIVVARLIRVVLELLGLIFLVIIIVAGFRWMTAGGDEEKVTASRKQLTNGVIGLVIMFAAYAIATYIINQLLFSITGIMPVSWSW